MWSSSSSPFERKDKTASDKKMGPSGGHNSGMPPTQQQQQHLKSPLQWSLPPRLSTTAGQADYIKFTRKNEDYPREQLFALGKAGRLNMSEIDKRIFCGIKIQIGIGIVTNFLHKGMQYKAPIKGRSELVNGSWTGVMRGLTIDNDSPISYDVALGNFLAWDEEFPYIKFGPFVAVESKLVVLTGSSRRIEASSFGTNMKPQLWLTILTLMLLLSLLSSLRIYSRQKSGQLQQQQQQHYQTVITDTNDDATGQRGRDRAPQAPGVLRMFQEFFFVYFTMLINKPSVEYDNLVWPKKHHHYGDESKREPNTAGHHQVLHRARIKERSEQHMEYGNQTTGAGAGAGAPDVTAATRSLPNSIRALSYMWSGACLVLASIYSGEMLVVMLLHADQNIDTIAQLINARPRIEPVIRQDDMTHNLMLKSMDVNMLKLYNMTKVIPRAEVYKSSFIQSVSERRVALLGDDELIETIYDLYHKYYPLYKSKMTYLQYPISIIYRKDLNSTLEAQLRRGMLQLFEMGLIHRWYQAQKSTYIKFYDTYERDKAAAASNEKGTTEASSSEQKYKPLSMQHFSSFFRAMLYCKLFAIVVLLLELVHNKLASTRRPATQQRRPLQQTKKNNNNVSS